MLKAPRSREPDPGPREGSATAPYKSSNWPTWGCRWWTTRRDWSSPRSSPARPSAERAEEGRRHPGHRRHLARTLLRVPQGRSAARWSAGRLPHHRRTRAERNSTSLSTSPRRNESARTRTLPTRYNVSTSAAGWFSLNIRICGANHPYEGASAPVTAEACPPAVGARDDRFEIHLPIRAAAARRLHAQARRRPGRVRRGLLRRLATAARKSRSSSSAATPTPSCAASPTASTSSTPTSSTSTTCAPTAAATSGSSWSTSSASRSPRSSTGTRTACRSNSPRMVRGARARRRLSARPRRRPPRPEAGQHLHRERPPQGRRLRPVRRMSSQPARRARRAASARRTTWPRRSRPATTASRSTSTPAASSSSRCSPAIRRSTARRRRNPDEAPDRHAGPEQGAGAFRRCCEQALDKDPTKRFAVDDGVGPGGRGDASAAPADADSAATAITDPAVDREEARGRYRR